MVILLHDSSTAVFAIADGKPPIRPTERAVLTSCARLREARGF